MTTIAALRREQLVEELLRQGGASVADLSAWLRVSEATIRAISTRWSGRGDCAGRTAARCARRRRRAVGPRARGAWRGEAADRRGGGGADR
ncbi:MAG: DeoR family transcriptional regulator [Thermomicrobiales bacterium]